jgi:hypothetical protein
MLMDPDMRRVDEDAFEIGILGQSLENALPESACGEHRSGPYFVDWIGGGALPSPSG